MRIQWGAFAAVMLSLVLGPRIAGADEVQQQLDEMSRRMGQLEDQLRATQDQLTAANEQVQQQQVVIERAGLADEESGISGLSAFLDTIEVGGLVAGSFLYNLNDPSEVSQAGTLGLRAFDADSQSFNFDQLIFQLGKEATTESRAGFGVEILYGKSAALLEGRRGSGEFASIDSALGILYSSSFGDRDDADFLVTEAYISYLAPELAGGVSTTFKAGKFYTLVGSEVLHANGNYNISRGLLYTLLQPVDHTGATVTFGFAEAAGVEGTAELEVGLVNSFASGGSGPDINDEKTFLGQFRYGRDNWSVSLGGLYGAEMPGDPESKLALVDVTATLSPAEGVDLWANFDWSRAEVQMNPLNTDPDAWGLSLGGHVEITQRMGAALRAEYVRDDEGFLGIGFADNEIWGLTGTLDYALTNHLMVRGEVRYDKVDNDRVEDVFPDEQRPGGFADSDQTSVTVEAVYTF